MKKTFYIFRHGQTDWNKERKVQGQTDIELNELGQEQAQELKCFFDSFDIDICYSSDLSRAYRTAEIAFSGKGVSIFKSINLREANFGQVEGMTRENLIAIYNENFWEVNEQSDESLNFCYPGGETRRELRDRLVKFIENLRDSATERNIAISTHGGALRILLHHFLPKDATPLPIPNCVVYKLTFDGDSALIEGPLNNN
ncbi:histidine phosphatase family protein [Halobacteriovorax sp. HLS]|uniref:histidine phosphatase family protein n=1 Tax=Halobacteriovorax sp. HLS TaxID=2234000 RepID=UPI000FD898E7|nr:histidine phosphatase family protein [Halobacteriovorax sp. HLS]